MKKYYPAVISKDKGSDYGLTFPDFDGCVAIGKTIEECIKLASSTLTFHITGMSINKEELPTPTPIENITLNKEYSELYRSVIEVVIPGKSKRVNIMLDENLLETIDSIVSNRSEFIEEAIKQRLNL